MVRFLISNYFEVRPLREGGAYFCLSSNDVACIRGGPLVDAGRLLEEISYFCSQAYLFLPKKLKIGKKYHSQKMALFCHLFVFSRRIKFIIFLQRYSDRVWLRIWVYKVTLNKNNTVFSTFTWCNDSESKCIFWPTYTSVIFHNNATEKW